MSALTILYDGWPIARQPASPAALHLLALLSQLPPQVQPLVAMPEPAPAWFGGAPICLQAAGNGPRARLLWEQFQLPRLASLLGARLLHFCGTAAPLFGPAISLVSPAGYRSITGGRTPPPSGLWARLRAACAQGGLARARALLWPADLPDPATRAPAPRLRLPALVHPAFFPAAQPFPYHHGNTHGPPLGLSGLVSEARRHPGYTPTPQNLPEHYILYHGPGSPEHLEVLLRAWSWASAPLAEQCPLVLVGLNASTRAWLHARQAELRLEGILHALPDPVPELLPHLYRTSAALFHPAPISPWGGAVRHALAAEVPVVACDSALADALVGPAGYLAPSSEPRALGAALVTVIIEEKVAAQLRAAAHQRAANWQQAGFGTALLEAYHQVLK
jgi:glycosyltransferase involved in cell wall biosynthesis